MHLKPTNQSTDLLSIFLQPKTCICNQLNSKKNIQVMGLIQVDKS